MLFFLLLFVNYFIIQLSMRTPSPFWFAKLICFCLIKKPEATALLDTKNKFVFNSESNFISIKLIFRLIYFVLKQRKIFTWRTQQYFSSSIFGYLRVNYYAVLQLLNSLTDVVFHICFQLILNNCDSPPPKAFVSLSFALFQSTFYVNFSH